jgi:hypothetical protein
MSQIQRKASHFILYLLLETRCTKRKGDGLTSCTLKLFILPINNVFFIDWDFNNSDWDF